MDIRSIVTGKDVVAITSTEYLEPVAGKGTTIQVTLPLVPLVAPVDEEKSE